ncbi:HIRA-interacting protein 5 [Cucurbitaria berberidis CBS 394.84]|uniref:HIRA-interacting protein 5 n=1 Tax=Cucurbitaria berberidis CBS 394.84 TaxID=1168544 RepID=A0A9P4GVA3_9PLEO|nr:HIRA-interacting protein 5 [Cucurbitaria berberidis CBS 394.84]KAF1852194.1 HIRA-interacting protein 5 [Cucurbitaria berberidis CBS 394.84]
MASLTLPRAAVRSLSRSVPSFRSKAPRIATRCLHEQSSPITASKLQHRPRAQPWNQSAAAPSATVARRTMFIQTEPTPNADALKFNPNQRVLPENISSPFLEYLNPRSTLAPPHPSPLAAALLNIDGVTSVFLSADYITVTKDSATPWAHVKPEVFALINEFMTSGQAIVNTVAAKAGEQGQGGQEADSLAYDENDEDVVGMIKELLDTRVRPAIQEDGGDIEFRGFNDGQVLLKLRGACRTCDSSTVTLKNGIESMLMHYIEEVKSVQQVLDPEEEISLQAFAKFEENLAQQKGPQAVAKTVGKGSLDYAEG